MDDGVQAEYLCTLQPFENSVLAQGLLVKRAACRRAGYDQDSTSLYPPHVSVTGFFKATQRQAQEFCGLVVRELISTAAQQHQNGNWDSNLQRPIVKVERVLATDDGHVILDVVAPVIAELAQALSKQASEIGLHVRPKGVRHLSIAAGRDPKERNGIAQIHEDLDLRCDCGWNLVVSRLMFRSDVATYSKDGTPHIFCDMLRFPITKALQDPGAFTAAARTLMTGNVNIAIPRSLPWTCEQWQWRPKAVHAEG
mmetsp:Transcript_89167/g.257056  ORF Transcript_89167/g.257056 Transcript_89167/m.257056 type:complete len:254 (-) Transcript_89167:100-861(-)